MNKHTIKLMHRHKLLFSHDQIFYDNTSIEYETYLNNNILYYKVSNIQRQIDLSSDIDKLSKLSKLILRDILNKVNKAHNIMIDERLSKDTKIYMMMTKTLDYKEAMNKFYELNELDKFLEFIDIVDYKELYTYKLMKMRKFLKVNNNIDNYLMKLERQQELQSKLAVKDEITTPRRKI